jgi:hypothetical protein
VAECKWIRDKQSGVEDSLVETEFGVFSKNWDINKIKLA